MKKGEGLEDARVGSQHALMGRVMFTTITTLPIEMVGCYRQKDKKRPQQLELVGNTR